jgi:hypothetical protein
VFRPLKPVGTMPEPKPWLKRQWDAAARLRDRTECDFPALCPALFPGTQPANSVPLQPKGPELHMSFAASNVFSRRT